MKRASKILAVLLALAMLLTLAACGGDNGTNGTTTTTAAQDNDQDNDTTEPADDEDPSSDDNGDTDNGINLDDFIPEQTLTLDVYTQLANYSGEQIGWFGQVMEERFNVRLNIINEGDGTFVTRMESGNLGDMVVFGNDGDEYMQAINAGLLFDWEEDNLVQDFGPYIWEHMQAALEKNRNISPDGTLYGFGHNVGTSTTDHESFFYGPYIRWDLYKELGYPEVNTLEDFIDVLEAMVELEPTSETGGPTYAVSMFPDWDGDMVMMVKSTAALYGWDEFGFGLYHAGTQEFQPLLEEDGMYIRMLSFYNQLHQRGILDPDSMTQTYDDMAEKYQTGAAFWNIFNWMSQGIYNTETRLADDKAIMALAANDQENIVYGLNINGGNRVWTIGANTAYPELVMMIINWLSTPEGKMTMEHGPQGVIWDYDDEGRPYLTAFGETALADGETEMIDGFSGTYSDGTNKINNETWSNDATNFDAANGDPYNYNFWETRLERAVSGIEQDWRDYADALSTDEYLINNGHRAIAVGSTYSQTPRDDALSTIWNQVSETIKTHSWNAIYAENDAAFDAIVADMIASATEYGYDECIEFQMNEADMRRAAENEAKAMSN